MSVVSFFSAKGAPGTTTAAMLAAALWPRPALLADCDPAGGDLGLRLPSPDGRPLDLGVGMLSLLPVARRSLSPDALDAFTQQVLGGGEVLVGLSGPEQAAAGGPVWATIAGAFAGVTGRDVIIDAGRLGLRSPVLPLVVGSLLTVCVIDTGLSGVFAARARLRTVIPVLNGPDGSGPRIAIVVRADDAREAQDAAGVIREEFPDLLYLGHLATDRVGAGIFSGRPVARPERTLLVRSGRAVVEAMQQELARMRLSTTDAAEQPWNTLTGEFAAYAPYLAADDGADRGGATSGAQPPTRSRVEERRSGQRSRFRRGKVSKEGA